MSYGLYCLCANNLVVDTTTITGVLQAAVSISTASSGTLSYPSLAGRTIFVQGVRTLSGTGSAYSNRSLNFSISYSSGYPVVTYSPVGSGTDYPMNVFILVR